MISTALTVYSSKGGVGKTSLTANLAAMAAASGWRVLTIDLDPQGSLAPVLGYDRRDEWDGGAALTVALMGEGPLGMIPQVRPGLDCVGGGPAAARLADLLAMQFVSDPASAAYALDRMLAPVAGDYDLILVDLPPTPSALHTVTLTTTHYVVMPTCPDKVSRQGLAPGVQRIRQVRDSTNPDLEILAAVIARHQLAVTSALRIATAALHNLLGDSVPVLSPPIRDNQKADNEAKEAGIVAVEYEAAARAAKTARLQWLRQRRHRREAGPEPPPLNYSAAAAGLADDYEKVLAQVIDRFSARQAAYHERVGV